MGTNTTDDVRAVMDGIRHVVRELRVSSRASERAVGLSGAQLFVLQQVVDHGPCRMGELADRTRTHQSSVSTVVARLEQAGFVQRQVSATDRRVTEVVPTADGLARMRSTPPLAQARIVAALHAMDPEVLTGLRQGLDLLVEAVAEPGTAPPLFFEDDDRGTP